MAASEPAPPAPVRGEPGGGRGAGGGAGPRARPRGPAGPVPGLRRGRAWARGRTRAARRREGAFRGRRESLVLSLGMGGSTDPSPAAASRPPAPTPAPAPAPARARASAPARADGECGGRGAGDGRGEPLPHCVEGPSLSLRLAAARFEEGGAGPRLAAARAAWDGAGLDVPRPTAPGPLPDVPSESPPGAQRVPPRGLGTGAAAGTDGASLFPFIGTGGARASPPWVWGGRLREARDEIAWPPPPAPAPGPAASGAFPAASLSF